MLLRSSPLRGSTEGEEVGVTVMEEGTWIHSHTHCTQHVTATVEFSIKVTLDIGYPLLSMLDRPEYKNVSTLGAPPLWDRQLGPKDIWS